jgi:hypothetical protein
MNAVDRFVVYDDVNHIKKGWVNRNRILKGDRPYMLIVPLKHNSQNSLIRDLQVSIDETWFKKTLKTFEHVYKKAPFFVEAMEIVYTVIRTDSNFLLDWHMKSFEMILSYLSIKTELKRSSELKDNKSLKGQDRIISICRLEGSKEYINLSGGVEIYSEIKFLQQNIELWFLQSRKAEYKQFKHNFLPFLSIIDVVMFNSVDKISWMLDEYDVFRQPKMNDYVPDAYKSI